MLNLEQSILNLGQRILQSVMMKIMAVLLLLSACDCSNNSLRLDCIPCPDSSSNSCAEIEGGPFANSTFQVSLSCAQIRLNLQQEFGTDFSLPATYTLSCQTVCSECQITSKYVNASSASGQTITSSTCSSSEEGEAILKTFNFFYRVKQQDQTATYDWCGEVCDSSKLPLILGIVFGVVGLFAVAGVLFFCLTRKGSKESLLTDSETPKQLDISE